MEFELNEIFKNSIKLKEFMKANGVAFNKRLGQNFLMQHSVLQKIIKNAEVENCGVLEIGAGLGNLTQALLLTAKKVIALELDLGLFSLLKRRFCGVDNLQLLNCDVLKINLKKLLDEEFAGMRVKICANLPYYLTSSFVSKVLEQRLKLESITLMLQKEAALRLCAEPGSKNCGAISYLIDYYSAPKIEFYVSKNCFYPVPKVDSCVVNLKLENKYSYLEIKNEVQFFKFIRTAFSQRRKFLISPIANAFNLNKEELKAGLTSLGLSHKVRAQNLNLEQFAKFFKLVFKV